MKKIAVILLVALVFLSGCLRFDRNSLKETCTDSDTIITFTVTNRSDEKAYWVQIKGQVDGRNIVFYDDVKIGREGTESFELVLPSRNTSKFSVTVYQVSYSGERKETDLKTFTQHNVCL